jgi:hypothetical protein
MAWYDKTKNRIAAGIYTVLDPIYGEGGFLEPVTVIVDPDRTVYEEYIEPKVEDVQEYVDDWKDDNLDTITDTASNVALGVGLLAVLYFMRS